MREGSLRVTDKGVEDNDADGVGEELHSAVE